MKKQSNPKKQENTNYQANLISLIENTTDDIWSVDANYQITTLNSNFQRNFQTAFSVSLKIGDNMVELLSEISEDIKHQWQERYDRALAGEHFTIIDNFEYVNVPQYIEAAFNPIKVNNEIIGVSVFSHDITNQKQIEEKLKKSEERYRLIAENTGDVIWIYDLSLNKFTYSSPSAFAMRGYTAEEIGTQSMEQVLTQNSYQGVMKELPKRLAVFAAGDKSKCIQTDVLNQVHKSGKVIIAEVVTTLLTDENNNVNEILGVARDITNRKKAETALQVHINKIELLQEKLREQAIRDFSTGLYNRYYMKEMLEREITRAKRNEKALGLMMMDIDYFKKINDESGHNAGDLILKTIGKIIQDNIRSDDIACRYGGDEILIVMPGSDIQTLQKRAELIRTQFESFPFQHQGEKLQPTVSIGIMTSLVKDYTSDQLINHVDKALYQAKNAGRNQVCVAPEKIITI